MHKMPSAGTILLVRYDDTKVRSKKLFALRTRRTPWEPHKDIKYPYLVLSKAAGGVALRRKGEEEGRRKKRRGVERRRVREEAELPTEEISARV